MNYINTTTLQYPLTEIQIKQDHPNVSFPIPFEPGAGYAAVSLTEQPAFNRYTHKAVELPPALVGGVWFQQWEVVSLTPEEAAAMVPQSVTRRQAKQALLLGGLLSQVQPAIDSIPDATQRALIQIEWDDSQVFERSRPALIGLATALGLNSSQLDALFIQASAL